MQLKQFTLFNYRKFGKTDNVVNLGMVPADTTGSFIATTLLVGQNNAGKTTIVSALEKLCGENDFTVDDFNYRYLQKSFETIKGELEQNPAPSDYSIPAMSFEMVFSVGDSRLHGIAPLLTHDLDSKEVKLTISVDFAEHQKLAGRLVEKKPADIEAFMSVLNEFKLKASFFTCNGDDVTSEFKIQDVVDLLSINISNLFAERPLSSAYTSIFNHIRKAKPEFQASLLSALEGINNFLSKEENLTKVIEEQSRSVNEAISTTMLANGRAQMKLTPKLSVEALAKDILTCSYKEGDFSIPESQYGAGYTCLLLIVSAILDHLYPKEDDEYLGKCLLVAIEEPESYMHPQMQKAFVSKIDDLMKVLLSGKDVEPETQILITTHSSKILDGKLRKDCSFNNIDYIRYQDRQDSHLVNISDSSLGEAHSFILKHVKYQCPDLFFADACILVEGQAEETLVPYFIEQRADNLSQFFLTIFSINGAYAEKYEALLRSLAIPSLIITDADPKAPTSKTAEETADAAANLEDEVEENDQVPVNDAMETTNSTLNYFGLKVGRDSEFVKDNICVVTQEPRGIQGKAIQPTSFEEALILDNLTSATLRKSLQTIIPKTYKKYQDNLATASHRLQNKLSKHKADFSIEILYETSTSNPDLETPHYISKGLDWLADKLQAKSLKGDERTAAKNNDGK